MRRVQVFDVNETLLDLAGLDPLFERVFGDAGIRQVWFAQLIQSALVATSPAPTASSAPSRWPRWR
jgi:2-haloacid dehalogenase